RSAMPGFMARAKCPELVFLPVRMGLYQEISREVFARVASLVPALEHASIDEAYFEAPDDPARAWALGARLRREILARFGLTCSIGIAPNKMLAKIMSGHRKPDAQLLLRPEQVESFM